MLAWQEKIFGGYSGMNVDDNHEFQTGYGIDPQDETYIL